ncbi:MAG: hypothetical protein J6U74_02000 [Clostridia bacterium]|nr:hypothetical protein [Clostridia bacterium]
MSYEEWTIKGHALEYLDDSHTYLVDGVIVPSITQALKSRFGNKYAAVDGATLQRAAEKGTEAHKAIEMWCRFEEDSDLPELKNFKFLQKQYHFEVLANEVPVILFEKDEPILAGRLDLVLSNDGMTGLGDIKRTSTLDKEYVGLQLNLYRIAYQQCFGEEIEFLRGLHLRENIRKYVSIPIKEQFAWDFIRGLKGENNE